MTKKIIAGVAGVVLLGVFLFGTRFFGYMGSMVDDVKTAANNAIPFEMKIKEAKKLVDTLNKEMTAQEVRMANTLAEEQNFAKKVEADQETLASLKTDLEYLASVVEGADSEHVYVNTSEGKQKRTVTEVKNKLEATLASYKNAQKSLDINSQNRDREKEKYEQYEQYYNTLTAKRDKLSLRIKELESEMAALETRKATEAAEFDDSAIQEAESFLNELEKDLAAERNLLDIRKNHGSFDVAPNVEEDKGDILDEVKKTLQKDSKKELISTDTDT